MRDRRAQRPGGKPSCLVRSAGFSNLAGERSPGRSDLEALGSVVVCDRGASDAALAAERLQAGDDAAQCIGCGTGGAEEIELTGPERASLGFEGGAFHGGCRRAAFERLGQQPHEHAPVEGWGGEPHAARVAAARFESEAQLECAAGQAPRFEQEEIAVVDGSDRI